MNTEIKNEYNNEISTDTKSFEFNLESNGRLKTMMKFPIKDTKDCGYQLFNKSQIGLIHFGNLLLLKENKKSFSYYVKNEDKYEHYGIPKALCGRIVYEENGKWKGDCFTPLRITVIQMI